MADATKIEWADATFNPWWGCEKVSPACAHCYAEGDAHRWFPNDQFWGDGHTFRFFGDATWAKPLKWGRLARDGKLPNGKPNPDDHRPRVFCASMADVFEERGELEEHRIRLFELIEETPELDWLILTKRPEFAKTWLPSWWSLMQREALPNVWLGVSIENSRFTWRADVLREIPAAVRFISAEPLLGSLFEHDHSCLCPRSVSVNGDCRRVGCKAPLDLTGIDWVIVGGESGAKARPFHLEHAREIGRVAHLKDAVDRDAVSHCRTAVFVKQLGAKPYVRSFIEGNQVPMVQLADRKGGDISEFPLDLRIREFPRSAA